VTLVLMAAWMRFGLLPLCVSCVMLCLYTLLLLHAVSSVSVRGVDAGGLGGLDAGCVGRVVDNAAACRGDVDVGAAAARSCAAELLSLRQVPPWLLWVEMFWHLLTGMVMSVL